MQDPGDLIVVLAPVLNRPGNARPLAESLRATTTARLIFLVNHDDYEELEQVEYVCDQFERVRMEIVPWTAGHGDYARKINHGVAVTTEPWIFQGADDLVFHPGWAEEALRIADVKGRRVIGTNDLCNPRVIRGRHSTHSLVARSYVEEVGTVDEKGKLLHEGYSHNFCDDELVKAAAYRREFYPAQQSIVEHLHPLCGKAMHDSTYEKGLARETFRADSVVARDRRRVWRKGRR